MSDFLKDLQKTISSSKKLTAISATADVPEDQIISTGLLPLDINLGGGIPRGRAMFIYGPKSNGKSTLADSIAASWHRANEKAVVLYVDSERSFDRVRAARIGYDLDRTFVLDDDKTMVLEDVYDQVNAFQDAIYEAYGDSVPVLIIWDTISICTSRSEAEGDKWGSGMMADARINTSGMKFLNAKCANYKHTALILQWVMQGEVNRITKQMQYKQGGAEALKHVAAVIMEVRRKNGKEDTFYDADQNQIGFNVDIKIRKNKLTGLDNRGIDLPLFTTSGFSQVNSTISFINSSKACADYFRQGHGKLEIYDHRGEKYDELTGKKELVQQQLAEQMAENEFLLKLVEYAGYKYYTKMDELFAAKYAKKLERLEKELDQLRQAPKSDGDKKLDLGEFRLASVASKAENNNAEEE